MRLDEGNVSVFQKKKVRGVLPTEFTTIDEKDDVHRIMTEVEPLLGALRIVTLLQLLNNKENFS